MSYIFNPVNILNISVENPRSPMSRIFGNLPNLQGANWSIQQINDLFFADYDDSYVIQAWGHSYTDLQSAITGGAGIVTPPNPWDSDSSRQTGVVDGANDGSAAMKVTIFQNEGQGHAAYTINSSPVTYGGKTFTYGDRIYGKFKIKFSRSMRWPATSRQINKYWDQKGNPSRYIVSWYAGKGLSNNPVLAQPTLGNNDAYYGFGTGAFDDEEYGAIAVQRGVAGLAETHLFTYPIPVTHSRWLYFQFMIQLSSSYLANDGMFLIWCNTNNENTTDKTKKSVDIAQTAGGVYVEPTDWGINPPYVGGYLTEPNTSSDTEWMQGDIGVADAFDIDWCPWDYGAEYNLPFTAYHDVGNLTEYTGSVGSIAVVDNTNIQPWSGHFCLETPLTASNVNNHQANKVFGDHTSSGGQSLSKVYVDYAFRFTNTARTGAYTWPTEQYVLLLNLCDGSTVRQQIRIVINSSGDLEIYLGSHNSSGVHQSDTTPSVQPTAPISDNTWYRLHMVADTADSIELWLKDETQDVSTKILTWNTGLDVDGGLGVTFNEIIAAFDSPDADGGAGYGQGDDLRVASSDPGYND